MHQLLAHDPSVNPAFLTGKFIDGLKPEIRAVVVLHRPKDLDTASSLAILQEEVLSRSSCKEYKKLESPNVSRHSSMYQHSKTNDTKSVEHAQPSTSAAKTDDKLANLMSYRRSKGLCFKCGGKWGPQHKCPTFVPLNLVEDIWGLLPENQTQASTSTHIQAVSNDDDDELMAISDNAMRGTNAIRTLKLHAYIGSHQDIILIDSGSSHNFISEQMASIFQPWTPLKHQMSVRAADGF
jgi:hypothetical protein